MSTTFSQKWPIFGPFLAKKWPKSDTGLMIWEPSVAWSLVNGGKKLLNWHWLLHIIYFGAPICHLFDRGQELRPVND